MEVFNNIIPSSRRLIKSLHYHFLSKFQTDLQTSSQRLTLSGTSNMPVPKLDPEESFDQVIHHEVKELGTHM